jgi:hypothetical protein
MHLLKLDIAQDGGLDAAEREVEGCLIFRARTTVEVLDLRGPEPDTVRVAMGPPG